MSEEERKQKKIEPFVVHEVLPAGRKPKFNYDSDEFYEAVYECAYQGMTDKEIAYGLQDRLGASLTPDTFLAMLGGRYASWDKDDNQYRSKRLKRALDRARHKINSVVRNRYLKMALGGWKTKNVTVVQRRMRIDGELTDNEDIQTSTTEQEYAPSLQALSVWLHHHDPEWRKYEGVVKEDIDDDPDAIPEAKKGIDIAQWIDKEVEDKEVMERISASEGLPTDTENLPEGMEDIIDDDE